MKKSILTAKLLALVLMLAFESLMAQENRENPVPISEATKNEVVESLLKNLNDLYVFPEVAASTTVQIKEFQKTEMYAKANDAVGFAIMMTNKLQEITHDKHMGVRYDPNAKLSKKQDPKAKKEEDKAFQEFLSILNYGFQKMEILRGNIGYLKIDGFAPVTANAKTVVATAMRYLQNTDAMIIDLRENHGGEPEMVQLLASYFFDKKPVHLNDLYYREGNRTDAFWTLSKLSGKRYLNPVYILTSNQTFSGGEEFTYDLQALKRATIMGETTGGGANPGENITIADGFSAFIPTGRAVNPITKTNWEGVGVVPDLNSDPENVMAEAHVLALAKVIETLGNTHPGGYYQRSLEQAKKQLPKK